MTEKLASFKVDNQEIKKWLPNNNVQIYISALWTV
jgi:hypothetical protein